MELGSEQETVLYSQIKVHPAKLCGYILFDSKNEPWICRRSTTVVQLICNQQVDGSNPPAGSM